jgi:hypothetical protein
MPYSEHIIALLIQSALILSGVYTIAYFQENAKNKSQAKYLEQLTTIVEEVKQRYVQENELLKSNLSLVTSKQNILFTEGKDAIIEFFSNTNKWIWHFLKISVYDYNISNYLEIVNVVSVMTNNYHETNLSFGKIQLLVNNQDVISAAHESTMKTLELHSYIEISLKELQRTLASEKSLSDTLFSSEKFEKVSTLLRDHFLNEAKKNSKTLTRIRDEFLQKKGRTIENCIR